MDSTLDKIINWSEVWALLIPLAVILIYKPSGKHSQILIYYVIIAFVLNSLANIMVEYYFSLPESLRNNNVLYNLHSLARVILFSWYILTLREYKYRSVLQLFLLAYLGFTVGNFVFIQSPFFINTLHFVAESILLLILCFSFFFRSIQDDSETNWLQHPAFFVCAGLSLYEAGTFFIYLFFYPLVEKDWEFGDLTMSIHNLMYVILCILIAVALYKRRKTIKALKTANGSLN